MNGLTALLLIGLGLVVVVVRRPAAAVGAVTAQALILVAYALTGATGAGSGLAAGALALRTLGLAGLLLFIIRETSEAKPVEDTVGLLGRLPAAAGLAVALVWLVPPLSSTSRAAERAVLALIALGLVSAATRRATLMQILSIIMVENGLVLAALQLLPHTSWLIDVGSAFDVTFLAVVAAALHRRIHAHFGSSDTGALRSLRG